MRFFLSVMLLTALLPAFSQQKVQFPEHTDTSYHLLWYKGKMIRPNVLLTRRYDTVTYIPAKGKVKVTGKYGKARTYDNMLAEINRTPQRTKEKMQQLAGKLPKTLVPHLAVPLQMAYDRVQADFSGPLANSFDLPSLKMNPPAADEGALESTTINPVQTPQPIAASANREAAKEDLITEWPMDKQGRITLKPGDIKRIASVKQVLDYYERHKNERITYVPAPPTNDYAYCNECDTAKAQRYKRDYEVFRKELAGADEFIMQQILAMSRQAQLLMIDGINEEVNRLMLPILEWLIERADQRGRLLVEKYLEDPSRTYTVLTVILAIDRHQQLLGWGKEDNFYGIALVRGAEILFKRLENAAKQYDYTEALNIVAILSADRQMQLLGSKAEFNSFDMINFNQFKLSMKVSGKLTYDKGYQLAEVEGDNWFAAVPDKQCKLQWVLLGPDKTYIKVKLNAAEFRGQPMEIPYVGTKNWEASKPTMHIDFCGDGKDSVMAYSFRAEGGQELWQYPPPVGVTKAANMSVILMACFIDVQREMQKAAYLKTPGNIEKMKQQMMQQYQQFMKSGGADMAKNAANMSSQEVQKMMQMANAMNAGDKMGEIINSTNIGSYLVLPQVYNRQKLVFKERLNGKELVPQNRAIEYAWFHISLEQDPNSPYHVIDQMFPGN